MGSTKFLYPVILVALWSSIFIATITRPSLFDDADSFHAEAVREMVQSGDWTTLRIDNGIRYLEKAPLMYWLAALSVSAFGLHDWAIRLPLALFSLLLILLVFRFGAWFWGEKAGFYSGVVIATCLGHYAFTRIFLPNIIVSFFIAFCIYVYARITIDEVEPKKIGPVDLWCAAFYVSAALAVLTMGLLGIVFPCGIVFVHILLTGNWKVIRRLQVGYGTIIFLLVAAPWHIAAAHANSDFLWFYFIREHVLRFLGLRYPKDSGTVPRWLFLSLHLAWLFPWSAFLWGLVRDFPKSRRPQEKPERLCLLLFVWIGVILLFFSFSTTQEYYTFPSLAAFALLLGKAAADLETGETSRKWGLIGLGVMAAVTLSLGACMIALALLGSGKAEPLSQTLTVNPKDYFVAFGHMHDLTAATFNHLADLVHRAAALLIVGPAAALLLALRKRWKASFLLLAIMMIGVSNIYNAGMIAFEPVLSSRRLATVIESHYRPGDKIVINGLYETGSSLNYYTGHQVYVVNDRLGVLWYGLQDKTAPKLDLTEDELLNEWKSGERIFLFSERKPLEAFLLRHPHFDYRVLAESGGKTILVNWRKS